MTFENSSLYSLEKSERINYDINVDTILISLKTVSEVRINTSQVSPLVHEVSDIQLPKSLNSMIFELLINFPKLSLFQRLEFILAYINHLQ